MKTILLAPVFCSLFGLDALAAPALALAKASGRAGKTTRLSIALDPGADPVASLQFSLLLPPSVSTVSVTAGPVMTTAGKSVAAGRKGDVWTFIVYGVRNQNTLGKGTLLTAMVKLASTTARGTLPVPIARVVFSNAAGETIAGGVSSAGAIEVAR